ncbi:MAG: bifunctional DNA primase/helicase [Pseudobdellovibrionaceae bacterium]
MSTFVSKHYEISPSEITSYLQSKGYDARPSGDQWNLKQCPTCHDTKGNVSNMWRAYVNRTNGAWMCHRCSNKGSWFDFKKANGDIKAEFTNVRGDKHSEKKIYKKPDTKRIEEADRGLAVFPEVIKFFENRNIKLETLKAYNVGAVEYQFPDDEIDGQWNKELCMTFPWKDPKTKDIVRIKGRSLKNKRHMRLDPTGGAWGLFGLHLVPDDMKELILTEGEIDCMSIYQETSVPAVSLPNGSRSLPPEVIEQLERFDTIILWLDDDDEGQKGAESFADKLGRGRCKNILTKRGELNGPKDANEALMMGVDLNELLASAERFPHEQIVTIGELKDEIFREVVNPKATNGIPWDSLPGLTNILKGHRRGEMTVWTGLPGTGKSTILAQTSLDIAKRGETSLWGSFEIKNTRLAKTMLYQNSGVELHKVPHEFDKHFKNLEKLPIYFMRYFGSTKTEDILDVMEYAAYALDVKNFYLDNLQFMTAKKGGHGTSKFAVQDDALYEIRQFSTKRQVHTSVVIHVGKSEDYGEIDPSNLSGTAKAYQECDNMILIQKAKEYRYLDVRKNRYDGDLGKIPYQYDKGSRLIYEISAEEVEALKSGEDLDNRARINRKKLPNFAPGAATGKENTWWQD